jgi:hypothetical protein
VTQVAAGAAAGVGAITLYLGIGSILNILIGIGSILNILTGGGSGDPPAPIHVTAININLDETRNDLNCLSSSSTLSFDSLNNTTTSILGYINNFT